MSERRSPFDTHINTPEEYEHDQSMRAGLSATSRLNAAIANLRSGAITPEALEAFKAAQHHLTATLEALADSAHTMLQPEEPQVSSADTQPRTQTVHVIIPNPNNPQTYLVDQDGQPPKQHFDPDLHGTHEGVVHSLFNGKLSVQRRLVDEALSGIVYMTNPALHPDDLPEGYGFHGQLEPTQDIA